MTPSIIECLDDPALFAGHFKGGTWGPWRTVLKALFALEIAFLFRNAPAKSGLD